MPVGTQFPASNWPLHSTVVDTFAINWDTFTMTRKLTALLKDHTQATSIAKDDRFFSDNSQVQVTLIKKTESLVNLHHDVIKLLERGGWKPNNPEFAKEGYLPHSTVQPHGRLRKGDAITFNALSIIDFFPNEDPCQRRVLATVKIGT